MDGTLQDSRLTKACQMLKLIREDLKVMIRECYRNEVLDPRLDNDEFDVVGSDGVIILPKIWPIMVQPGLEVTIHIWPSTSTILQHVESGEQYERDQRNAERDLELERDRDDTRQRHRRLEQEWELARGELGKEREEIKLRQARLEREWEREREERRQKERRLEQEWETEREERRSRDRHRDLEWQRQREEMGRRDRGLEKASSSQWLRKSTRRNPSRQNVRSLDRPFSRVHTCLLWFAGAEKSNHD